MYKVLVCGSRTWRDKDEIHEHLQSLKEQCQDRATFFTVIHGACPTGADKIADIWCKKNNVPVKPFPANWDKYGKAAGPIRNKQMVQTHPDLVLAFSNGSKGTQDTIDLARKAGIEVKVIGKERRWH